MVLIHLWLVSAICMPLAVCAAWAASLRYGHTKFALPPRWQSLHIVPSTCPSTCTRSTDTAIQSFSFAPFSLSLARPEGNLCGPHTLTDLPSKRASKLICHYTTAGLDHHGGRRRSLSPLQLAVNVSLVRQLKSLFTLKLSSGVKNCFARGFLLVS